MKKITLKTGLIILLGITTAVTLLGAIGSFCIAFTPEKYGPKFAGFVDIKPYFQFIVLCSLAAGGLGAWATFRSRRGVPKAYVLSLIFLVTGLALSAIQMVFSATIRGSTAPNNIRVYITAFTLLVFLVIRLPGVWVKVNGGSGADKGGTLGGAKALMLCGLLTLTTPLWVEASHMVDGYNTANELLLPLILLGLGMTAAGGVLLSVIPRRAAQSASRRAEKSL